MLEKQIQLLYKSLKKQISDANIEKIKQGASFSSFIVIWCFFSFVIFSGKYNFFQFNLIYIKYKLKRVKTNFFKLNWKILDWNSFCMKHKSKRVKVLNNYPILLQSQMLPISIRHQRWFDPTTSITRLIRGEWVLISTSLQTFNGLNYNSDSVKIIIYLSLLFDYYLFLFKMTLLFILHQFLCLLFVYYLFTNNLQFKTKLVSAYNGSLTSSLASPTLSKPLNTFEEIAKESSSLNILLRNDSFQTEFMRTSSSKYLRMIYERSEKTGLTT